MTALPTHKMTVDEYLTWAQDNPGRFELYAGVVYAMTPERVGHARVKFGVQMALRAAIQRSGLPCHMLPDGMTVRVGAHTAHEPDALVYCGELLPDGAMEVPNPVIVVEVLSPSTRHIDASAKLAGFPRSGRAALSDRRSRSALGHSSRTGRRVRGDNAHHA